MFKIGDKVVCVVCGNGVVDRIEDGCLPVKVNFRSGKGESYTLGGLPWGEGENQTLFHADGYKPPVGGKEPDRCEFEKGEMVLVRDDIDDPWEVVFFVKMVKKPKSGFKYTVSLGRGGAFKSNYVHCVKYNEQKAGTIDD